MDNNNHLNIGEKYTVIKKFHGSENYSIELGIPVGETVTIHGYKKPRNVFQALCSFHGKASEKCQHVVVEYKQHTYVTHICNKDIISINNHFAKTNE